MLYLYTGFNTILKAILSMKRALSLGLITVGLLLVITAGCQYTNEPTQIISGAETIKLTWDVPLELLNKLSVIRAIRVYYRNHPDGVWTFLHEVPISSTPVILLHHNEIGNGIYDFGVCYVYKNNLISPLHSSLDDDALPIGGWYLMWIRPE
jgi:hypothetical protein